MNNKILKIQEMLLNQMKRLDDEEIMKNNSKREIMRSGALSQSASAYVKAVNISLKIKELSKNNSKVEDLLKRELGIINEE